MRLTWSSPAPHVLAGRWEALYENEVATFKPACGNAHMKVILGPRDLLRAQSRTG